MPLGFSPAERSNRRWGGAGRGRRRPNRGSRSGVGRPEELGQPAGRRGGAEQGARVRRARRAAARDGLEQPERMRVRGAGRAAAQGGLEQPEERLRRGPRAGRCAGAAARQPSRGEADAWRSRGGRSHALGLLVGPRRGCVVAARGLRPAADRAPRLGASRQRPSGLPPRCARGEAGSGQRTGSQTSGRLTGLLESLFLLTGGMRCKYYQL